MPISRARSCGFLLMSNGAEPRAESLPAPGSRTRDWRTRSYMRPVWSTTARRTGSPAPSIAISTGTTMKAIISTGPRIVATMNDLARTRFRYSRFKTARNFVIEPFGQ